MRIPILLFIILIHHGYSMLQDRPVYLPEPTPCFPRCRFRFCGFVKRIVIGAPRVVHKSPICKLGSNLEDIFEVGEASVFLNKSNLVGISKWRPKGLDSPFRNNFFGVGKIPGDNPGVFTRKPKGNQFEVLRGICVVLPIKKYSVEKFNGALKTKVARGRGDCVSFSVGIADTMIELEWFSGDDLDLSVREPNGTVLNFRNLRSKCGVLKQDNCIDCCGLVESARERVTYRTSCEGLQRGKYKAIVRHASNCGEGTTKWILRLIVGGTVTKVRRGYTDKDEGRFAGGMRFRL